ncbi:hypothetical protein [Streptomyces cellulosae]|uniref:PknH-like extracellular domain-containing protein n=1 Tax=Streptomyces cellulosae TaxID=1968 RepID=A0ABW7YIB4_STRCE
MVVLADCGGGSEDDAKPSKSATSASASTTAPTADETSEDPYPPTVTGDIDRKAHSEGWTYDDSLYSSASEYVQDMCDSLYVSAKEAASRPQWLAESGNMDGDGKAILEVGIPKLCPEWSKTLRQAVSGKYDRWFGDGNYDVKVAPGPTDADSDVEEIVPGQYRTRGDLSECYWERASQSGTIIANNFATQARVITVMLRAGELFHAEGCGIWKPVK